MSMDSRQLIKFGKSSYVVSIPPAWLRKNGLEKGDKVNLFEQDDNLVMSAKKETLRDISVYYLNTEGKSLKRIQTEIVSAYLNNHDMLEISNRKGLKYAIEIRNALQNLAGLEILEQTHNKIIAKDLINTKELSIAALVRRMDVIAKSMLTDFYEAIKKPSKHIYDSIYQRDNDVNRLCFLTYRVLRKALSVPSVRKDLELSQIALHEAWLVSMRIEKIADFSKRMARTLVGCKLSKKATKELELLVGLSIQRYRDVMSYYYNFDKNKAFDMESSSDVIIQKCNSFWKHNTSAGAIELIGNLKNLNTSIRNIARSVISGENPASPDS